MCLFCKIINQDIPSYKIYEDEHTYAFLDISPMSKGHTLVVPKLHSEHVLEAPSETIVHCFNTIKAITGHYDHVLHATGYNIVSNVHKSSGQSVFHTHFHIIPRYILDDGLFDSFKEVKEQLDLFALHKDIKL
jgi:histidine triad (HIT) family protein